MKLKEVFPMKMNRIFAVVLSLVLLLTSLGICPAIAEENKINVVTTIFPIYDWVREIAGDSDRIEITMLLDSGVDLHSYQPTAADIMKIATCDVFIYVGGESDEWVEDILAKAVNPSMIVINLVEALGDNVRMEEIVEGMEHEHDHDHEDHDEDHDHEHDHEHEEEADEHVWLSLRNAQKLVRLIANELVQVDTVNAAACQANAEAYLGKLSDLDARYTAMTESATYRTVLFGDRFPFRYLTDDYGLSYYAAFSGCSAETEASFQTIVFLAQKVDELGLPAVMTIEDTNHKIAETIVQTTSAKNQKVLTLNSMQGTTAVDVQAGARYLSIMENNLDVLREALN